MNEKRIRRVLEMLKSSQLPGVYSHIAKKIGEELTGAHLNGTNAAGENSLQ